MSRRKKKPTKATSLCLSPEIAAELAAVARAQGVTISEVVGRPSTITSRAFVPMIASRRG